MSVDTLPDLYAGSWTVTGNVAKVKVLHDLNELLSRRPGLRVLDIGCIGPHPLDFWRPLLNRLDFHLTGVDVAGLELAEPVIREHGWGDRVTLRLGSGYELGQLFPPASFDVVIATQVLEHVAQLPLFMEQVAAVLRPGGDAFFTLDSAHWMSRYSRNEPVRLVKNVVKKGLSLLGNERHYDLPWYDHEVAEVARRAGMEMVQTRYHNLLPLKRLHTHVLPEGEKNALMQRWYELEEFLNGQEAVRADARHLFLNLYVHTRKTG